jgi:hypothetical protein
VPIQNAELMRRAFQYSSMFGKTIFNRPEMRELARDGVMHDGNVSLVLGLSGIPAAAEEAMASRDITLAEATGGVLHLTQVSTANTIDLVRRARRRGVRVTCGVTPHHLVLTDEAMRTFDSNFKVHPPLRGGDDVEACIAGLQDGTIDVICSQHAPHSVEKKLQELDRAPFGAVGLETLLGVLVSRLVVPGRLDWPTLLSKLTINPARILGVEQGTLRIGADADITIIVPLAQRQHTVCRLALARRGRDGDRRRRGAVHARSAHALRTAGCPRALPCPALPQNAPAPRVARGHPSCGRCVGRRGFIVLPGRRGARRPRWFNERVRRPSGVAGPIAKQETAATRN